MRPVSANLPAPHVTATGDGARPVTERSGSPETFPHSPFTVQKPSILPDRHGGACPRILDESVIGRRLWCQFRREEHDHDNHHRSDFVRPRKPKLQSMQHSNGFFDSFHSIFKNSHPDVAPMFARMDFTKQNELLRVALGIMLMIDHAGDAAKQILTKIRESHSRNRLNIRPELYDCWVDSLMRACAQHDPEFSAETQTAWREVLQKRIDYIRSG